MTGLYVKQALQSSILVATLADKKVQREMPKYPDIPKSDEDIETEEHLNAQRELLIAKMNKWKKINNMKNKK